MPSPKVASSENHVDVTNEALQLGFTRGSQDTWHLATLRRPDGADNWVVEGTPAPLWRARFFWQGPPLTNDPSPSDATSLEDRWVDVDGLSGPAALEIRTSPDAVSLSFTWSDVTVAPTDQRIDVSIAVSLSGGSPVSCWTAELTSSAASLGLWQFDFPLLQGLRGDSRTRLIVPDGWGVQVAHPARRKEVYLGHYPSGRCVMQLVALTDGNDSLYLATEDKRAFYKQFHVTGDEEQGSLSYAVRQFPGGMGSAGGSYKTPFYTAIGVLPGGWESAARRYREWALTAPWTAKGKLAERSDAPPWVKDTVLWATGSSRHADDVEAAADELVAFAKRFGVPTAVHWYGWHEIPFDDHYPEYFPARAGFQDAVERVQRAGIRVMPYINGRLWDPRTESWREDDGYQACAKDIDQACHTESYATKVEFAVMCPVTSLWQRKIGEIVARLADEFGVDGVYIDQIGAARPQLCFDASHGHPVGGGDFWVRGYEQMLRTSRERGKRARPDLVLTTEDAAEAYGAELDAFLMCNSTRPDLVPLYPMVYSGLFLTFGRYIFDKDMEDPASFRTKMGQMFLWGAQLGWMAPGFILKPEHAESAAFLRELALAKARNHGYLALGELVCADPITSDVPTLTTRWCMWNPSNDYRIEPLHPITMPCVQGTVWKHHDESGLAVFLVNMSEEDQRVGWSIGVAAASAYEVYEQHSGQAVEVTPESGKLSGVATIPRLSVRVIELRRR